ncbi:MAG: hypothetical protein IJC94_05445 [Oscillospiraceae bacterium]|nr:hypothetical protein [Oscillospiraceae bacterium]
MTKGKGFNVVGVLLGIAVVIWGIVFMFTPADHYSTYSSKSASFGADYYTYQYEATVDAVHNTAVTANNIRDIGRKLAVYSGSAFVVGGLLIVLHYGKCLAVCSASAEDAKKEAPAPLHTPEAAAITEENTL